MRILYVNDWHVGHFPHMFPYYKKLGGLIYISDENAILQLQKEYKWLNITSSIDEINKFNPEIVMCTDYHAVMKSFIDCKTVMVFHAIENKGYFVIKRPWNSVEDFDLCLLYSETFAKSFKDNGFNIKGKVIGYPRFDDIGAIKKPIFNNDRKIILVAPTWSDESLLTKFTDEVIKLSEKYNVIVKPHNQTTTGKDCNGKKLKKLFNAQNDNLVLYHNCNILPLMKIADMLVTDVSGCSNEFMFFDKPLVVADNGVRPVSTGKKPPIWKVLPICDKPEELIALVDVEFENDSMKVQRNEYFKQMVYTEEGTTATERGIKAMKELIGEKE